MVVDPKADLLVAVRSGDHEGNLHTTLYLIHAALEQAAQDTPPCMTLSLAYVWPPDYLSCVHLVLADWSSSRVCKGLARGSPLDR